MTCPDDYSGLATLLHDDVAASEPTAGLDAMVPVRLGRRRLRTRRLVSGAAALVVVGAGAAVAVPLVHDAGTGPQHAIDPASQKALDDYDPQRMPQLMDDRVRSVLERSVPDLGPVTFRASDGNGDALPANLYDKASGMSVSYGPPEHLFSIELSHARSEAEGSAQAYCTDGLGAGYYLECTVDTNAAGDTVISQLLAVRPMGKQSGIQPMWQAVTEDELASVNPDRVWFWHNEKVIKSETLVTYVREEVKAPTREAAEAAFRVPVADLVEIGSDPVLVMPAPPLADDGCGPYVVDPDHGKQACDDAEGH